MATKQVSIPSIGTITLYKRRGNRSLRLSFGTNGEVRVSLPYWLPYKAGEQFALRKQTWILENRPRHRVLLRHGQAIGKAHRLCFMLGQTVKTPRSRVAANEIRISIPHGLKTADPSVQTTAHAASIRALKKEAEALLPQRLAALSQQTGLEFTSVSVKPLKSRWGSCNSDREITLNIFLMQLSWHLIDYVLVHELTHTKIMQHGAPFWREMERHLPTAKHLRKQIGEHKPILTPIDRSVS